jgi:hypothetical protein
LGAPLIGHAALFGARVPSRVGCAARRSEVARPGSPERLTPSLVRRKPVCHHRAVPRRPKIDRKFIDIWSAKYHYPGEDQLFSVTGAAVRARGEYTREELLRVGRWKSARATSSLAKNSDELVAAVTRTALAAPTLIKHRVLTILSGVGVPIASALLTIWKPEEFTVIDVRAISTLRAAGLLQPGADLPPYVQYVDLCRRLAMDNRVDLRSLDRALWQWSASDGVLKSAR